MKKTFQKVLPTSEENIFLGASFYQVAGLELTTKIKKRVQYRCFSVNFVEFLRTAFCKAIVTATFGQ